MEKSIALRAAHTAISRYDREIARTFSQHTDASLFDVSPVAAQSTARGSWPHLVLGANFFKAPKPCSTSAVLLPY
jgi:hypothetical protein